MLPASTINYMILSQEQSAANIYSRDDESMSFACRMYSIFELNILGNPRTFNRLRDGEHVLPWYCDDVSGSRISSSGDRPIKRIKIQ